MSKKHGSHGKRTTGRKWQKRRESVLAANPICVACSAAGRVASATEVDHIVPLQHGGDDSWDNLQSLCHDCHVDKTNAEMGRKPKAWIGLDGWPVGVDEK
jgi:5-methylcytosine-specific restriction protein A